jgi:DNA-binding IclR family transcriptional regulator
MPMPEREATAEAEQGDKTPEGGEQPQTIAGVERALDVMSLFVDGAPDRGVTEISDELGLSKAVVHRILASCRGKGYVELDEETRRYRLGPRALELGLSYLNRVDVMAEARSALQALSTRTDETATHSVRAGWNRVYIDQVTPARDIKMVIQIGGTHPLHAGATGKALLAFLSRELEDAYFAQNELTPVTTDTVTQEAKLREELAITRERGYALSMGERLEGAGSVAAPVFDHTGAVIASISVCGPLPRFTDEIDSCAASLVEVTADVSRRLGHRGQLVG